MTRPGVVVTSRADAPPRSAPTDVGMAFMVGVTEKGADVKTVASLSQYQAEFGTRQAFTDAYDAAETFFREGGAKLTVSRVVAGAAADPPTADDVPTGTAAEVLAWVGSEHDRAQLALDVEQGSDTPRSTLIASLEGVLAAPAPQAAATDVAGALARLTRDLGPGQVFIPGAIGSTDTSRESLLTHAAGNNRIALLDALSDEDSAGLIAIADAIGADADLSPLARYGALFAPAAIIPGLTTADTRTVPFSAVEAGIIARNDAGFTANVAAAGVNGESRTAIDLTATFTDAERELLNDAGVDTAKMIYGAARAYGYRTLAPLDSGWGLLSNARLNMEIVAKAEEIGERYLFTQIDGRRVVISQFGADLTGMLVPFYEAGSLYGTSASDAFYVDVGPAVNTDDTIAAGDLRAILGLRMSPFAEYVLIEIVKVATETPLSLAA